MEIYQIFPNYYPGAKTHIVLKNLKTNSSDCIACTLEVVTEKLQILHELQQKMRDDFGDESYIDYSLVMCQANGRPIYGNKTIFTYIGRGQTYLIRKDEQGFLQKKKSKPQKQPQNQNADKLSKLANLNPDVLDKVLELAHNL